MSECVCVRACAGLQSVAAAACSRPLPCWPVTPLTYPRSLGAIPIVNENDTVAVQELRIGDNDTLSAQVGRTRAAVLPLAAPGRLRLAGCAWPDHPPHLHHSLPLPSCLHILTPQVATLVQAEWLFLLTDVPNLFTANPNTDPTAQPIYEVHDLSKLHVSGTGRQGAAGWGAGVASVPHIKTRHAQAQLRKDAPPC